MLDLSSFEALTFDCYGTLIDWEQGILDTLKPLLCRKNASLSEEQILTLYAKQEAEAERGEFCNYKEILRRVLVEIGRAHV